LVSKNPECVQGINIGEAKHAESKTMLKLHNKYCWTSKTGSIVSALSPKKTLVTLMHIDRNISESMLNISICKFCFLKSLSKDLYQPLKALEMKDATSSYLGA